MFETLIMRSQMESDEPSINIKNFDISSPIHRISFWVTNLKRRTFSVPTRRFWAIKLGHEPSANL